MKLHYFNASSDSMVSPNYRNFGDDLNPWLWSQLLPDVFNRSESVMFLGIGSHLNSKFAQRFSDQLKVVFGTGYGSGEPIRKADKTWKIYCVRGPLTAESMGLEKCMAVTDAAVLVRKVYEPSKIKTFAVSYMPHCRSSNPIWNNVCDNIGINYIDPRWPLETVLEHISRTQIIISEALHGAIVADALRVPWISVVTSPMISRLKWQDWCLSVGIEYAPQELLPIWPLEPKAGLFARTRNSFKARWNERKLRQIIKSVEPKLSGNELITERTREMESRLSRLREDISAGRLSESLESATK